jgi:hypothetical protein
MNRKQKRRLRKCRNRENYLRNRRHWSVVGPPVVMDEPTEDHVKALLMEWLGPRTILKDVEARLLTPRLEMLIHDYMVTLAGSLDTPRREVWSQLIHGVLASSPALPFKIDPA